MIMIMVTITITLLILERFCERFVEIRRKRVIDIVTRGVCDWRVGISDSQRVLVSPDPNVIEVSFEL